MDRRKFLQSLALFGASAAPAAFALSGQSPTQHEVDQSSAKHVAEKALELGIPSWEGYRLGVIAIGGAGCSVLSGLHGSLRHLDRSIAIDLDRLALHRSVADQKILVGGGEYRRTSLDTAEQVVQAQKPEITEAVAGLDAVLIVAAMGGNAGTCLSPAIAEILREKNIMALGAAISPFAFEGMRRNRTAGIGLQALGRHVNALVPISHQALSNAAGNDALFLDVLAQAQGAAGKVYEALSITLGEPGLIGIDLLDVQNAITQGGHAALGFGSSSGSGAAENAARAAIKYPLLGLDRLCSAQGVLVAIEGSPARVKFREIGKAFDLISSFTTPQATVTLGATPNPAFTDICQVTVLASSIRHP